MHSFLALHERSKANLSALSCVCSSCTSNRSSFHCGSSGGHKNNTQNLFTGLSTVTTRNIPWHTKLYNGLTVWMALAVEATAGNKGVGYVKEDLQIARITYTWWRKSQIWSNRRKLQTCYGGCLSGEKCLWLQNSLNSRLHRFRKHVMQVLLKQVDEHLLQRKI